MGGRLKLLSIALALVWAASKPVHAGACLDGATCTEGDATSSGGGNGRLVAAKKKAKAAKHKKPGKGKKRGGADTSDTASEGTSDAGSAATPAAPAAPAAGASAPAAPAAAPGVLDLNDVQTDTEQAKQELLQGTPAAEEKKPDAKPGKGKKKGGGFDFGGGVEIDLGADAVDFGSELGNFDIQMNAESEERTRVDKAIAMMSEEEYAKAALEFRFFLDDPKYAEFKQESEYQLAKALYKLGFLDAALKRFRAILDQGASHARYRKSIEWLFFMSRRMADETPVLAELARFRNVTFPKAYRNEYRYLLGKYLFVQAQRFEVQRLQEEQLARSKKSKAATIDFSAAEEANKSGGGGFDFGAIQGLDFGGESGGGAMDFGGGGGGGATPAGDAGGGFDFGGGGGAGGAAPAGGAPAGGDAGGFDFGAGGGGGFDFGGGGTTPAAPAPAKPGEAAPVRDVAPSTAKEAIAQGVDFINQLDKESKFYPRAKYLQGLLFYLNGDSQKAVDAFQEVVRVLNPRSGVRLDPKLREMAFLSLARLHYGAKQFGSSVHYYELIDRDSENWLTALFEASWAYYRRGDFEKALGNLLTLHSPFFEREYFPESQLVKAIIYFEACRYPETRQILDDFIGRFTDVMKEIEKIAQSQEAPELLYDRIAQLQKDKAGEDDVTARVVALALGDADIRTARDVVREVNEQSDLLRQMPEDVRQSRLGSEIAEDLRQAVADRTREAGEITRRKFESELYALKNLLAQAYRIKIEVVSAEKQALDRKLKNEADTDALVPAKQRTVVDDEHVYWPYEGEYWRDELGTYELDFSMCRPLGS